MPINLERLAELVHDWETERDALEDLVRSLRDAEREYNEQVMVAAQAELALRVFVEKGE